MLILIVLEIKNIKTIVYLDMVYIILYPFNIFFVPIRLNTGMPQ